MALRADSYGSVAEVVAYTRHLLSNGVSFDNELSRPSLTEVETFIDRASGSLNVALNGVGLTTPVTNSTAKLACADWVVNQAAAYVELTQRGAGYDGTENTRPGSFLHLNKSAQEFAAVNALGFKRLGVGVSHAKGEGLQFTGMDAEDQRTDPDDITLEQPKFSRGLFDNE
jgi:hypothetical protein